MIKNLTLVTSAVIFISVDLFIFTSIFSCIRGKNILDKLCVAHQLGLN